MKQKLTFAMLLLAFLFGTSCKEEVLKPDISGMETTEYLLNIGDKVTLAPSVKNLKGNTYSWWIDGKKVSNASLSYTFEARQPGTFTLVFKAENQGGLAEQAFKLVVEEPIKVTFGKPIYITPKCKVFEIEPVVTGPDRDDYTYEWMLGETLIGTEKNVDFISAVPGKYELKLTVSAGKQKEITTCNVKVEDVKYNAKPISILDYIPAANSYWHLISTGKKFNDYIYPRDEFLKIASEDMKKGIVKSINVGNWGSSVTVGFDHTVVNIKEENDIEISNGNYIPGSLGFYVAYDKNKNGKPDDDEWYMIPPQLNVEDYERTYTFIGNPEFKTINKLRYCIFTYEVTDNKGMKEERKMSRNIYDFAVPLSFPGYFVKDEKIEMKEGWKKSYSIKGKMAKIEMPNFLGSSSIFVNIANAVDEKGKPVMLPGIDFLKIQQIGIIFEGPKKEEVFQRNEILGIKDTHL